MSHFETRFNTIKGRQARNTMIRSKTHLPSIILSGLFLSAGAIIAIASPVSAAATDDPVYFRLSGRHFNDSVESLEAIAGGREKLTAKLLELRHSNGLPYVSVRAEKLLVELANDEDGSGPVSSALEEDVAAPGYEGLARVVVTNIDSVQSETLRASLASRAIAAHQTSKSMNPYLKNLVNSSHADVRAAARTLE